MPPDQRRQRSDRRPWGPSALLRLRPVSLLQIPRPGRQPRVQRKRRDWLNNGVQRLRNGSPEQNRCRRRPMGEPMLCRPRLYQPSRSSTKRKLRQGRQRHPSLLLCLSGWSCPRLDLGSKGRTPRSAREIAARRRLAIPLRKPAGRARLPLGRAS